MLDIYTYGLYLLKENTYRGAAVLFLLTEFQCCRV